MKSKQLLDYRRLTEVRSLQPYLGSGQCLQSSSSLSSLEKKNKKKKTEEHIFAEKRKINYNLRKEFNKTSISREESAKFHAVV